MKMNSHNLRFYEFEAACERVFYLIVKRALNTGKKAKRELAKLHNNFSFYDSVPQVGGYLTLTLAEEP